MQVANSFLSVIVQVVGDLPSLYGAAFLLPRLACGSDNGADATRVLVSVDSLRN